MREHHRKFLHNLDWGIKKMTPCKDKHEERILFFFLKLTLIFATSPNKDVHTNERDFTLYQIV